MADTYREVTTKSWGSRLKSSLGGVIFGLILFLVGILVLFKNEGRAVTTAKSLAEGAGQVVSVPSDRTDPEREGRLIHFTGLAETSDLLEDPVFGVRREALRLRREVEMYQWQEESHSETETKVGGGTETVTTYTYDKGWSDRHHDSSTFKKPAGHENPEMPYTDAAWTAADVSVGAFQLPEGFVERLSAYEPLHLEEGEEEGYPNGFRITEAGNFYRGATPSSPEVGDLRITFEIVPEQNVSVVAQQVGNTVGPFPTEAGKPISMIRSGVASADAMFQAAERSNTVLTWVLRGVGLLLLFLAVRMILGPLAVLADVLPPIGALTRMGTSFVALLVALPVGLLVIAVAWVFYRPLLGITLVVLGVAGLVALLVKTRKEARKATPTAAPAPAAGAGDVPPPPPPP
ncbi:MAG: TMEM43 family protein [Thermoanaerobaculia bacterium]|nr:TMEM43 family protein [Thermoanaerobaculia bacterium]